MKREVCFGRRESYVFGEREGERERGLGRRERYVREGEGERGEGERTGIEKERELLCLLYK